jgi:mono/diheme cytochrome c family protein
MVTARLMAAFAFLSAAFVAAAPHVTATASSSSSQQVRRLLDGEGLFQGYCASCHGRTGKGEGPAAQALKTRTADLTLLAQRNGGTFPRERVTRYIASGEPATAAHGSKDMPVWGPVFVGLAPGSFDLINPLIVEVVRYLESLQAE